MSWTECDIKWVISNHHNAFFIYLLTYKLQGLMRFRFLSLFFIAGLILAACSGEGGSGEELVAKGGKKYGGEFKFMSPEKITNLFPVYNADLYTMRVVSQLYDPLLNIDPTTQEVVPCIAESFTVSDDAKVYTLKIRKGIVFHEDDCFGGSKHELDAHDVKFTLDMACSGLKDNQVGYLLVNRVKGGKAFFDKTEGATTIPKEGVEGIKVKDDYTIEITLEESFAGFESVLTHASLGIAPREAFDKYGKDISLHPVGSGPFMLESYSDDKIVMKRNPNYWMKDEFGNQLPFLSKIEMSYAEDKRSELMAFRKKEIDLVLEIPVEEIEHILGTLKEAQEGKNVRHKVDSEHSMSMMYISMANKGEVFSDRNVRKAFNLAVNREEIIDEWLEGEGWPALHGFVPKMNNYPQEKVNGHEFNVEKAKALMASAGYPNGRGFPQMDFYVNATEGSSTHKSCQAVAQQLKDNLGVKLNIVLCTIEEREEAIQNGKAQIWRAGWIADYPDPENFLGLFYGGNIKDNMTMVNAFKFQNEEFDKYFEQALMESDYEKRMELLVKCDQIVVDEAPVMPVLTDDHIVMINARVRNFEANPMESLQLTGVFIKEPKKD